MGRKYNTSQKTFLEYEDLTEEERKFLQTFAFICELSFDVYIKKMMIEKLIDEMPQEEKPKEKANKKTKK